MARRCTIAAAGFRSVQRPGSRRFELEPVGSVGLLLSTCRARGCSPPLVAWRGPLSSGRSILPRGWLPPALRTGLLPRGRAGSRRHSNLRGSCVLSPGPSAARGRSSLKQCPLVESRSTSRFGERDRSPACFGERGRRSRSSACFGERERSRGESGELIGRVVTYCVLCAAQALCW